MKYNLAVISFRKLFESLEEEISKKDLESFIKLLAPICPHLAEELWEKSGNKNFISQEKWPVADESKIDKKLDYLDEAMDNLRKDMHEVLELLKVKKPKKIKLIVADSWKYDFIKVFRSINSRNIGEIMAGLPPELKKHGQEITKLVPAFLKDASKLPKADIDLEDEIKALEENKEDISKEFGCEIVVEKAEDSKEAKAKGALPGKPSILLEK